MQYKHLIISKSEDNKYTNSFKKVYAGHWCVKKKLRKNDYIYDWNSNNNFKKNYKYLDNIINDYCNILSKRLNYLHNKNESSKYWEILLFPWLTYYIPAQFYRWKTITDILKTNKKLHIIKSKIKDYEPVVDSMEFQESITNSDYLNNIFFSRIINYLYENKKFSNNFFKDKNFIQNNDINKYRKIKINLKPNLSIRVILEKFLNIINLKKNIFICEGLLSTKDLIKLNFLINENTIFSKKIFDKLIYLVKISELKVDKKFRVRLPLKKKYKDNFLEFIDLHIMTDMPKNLLEGFELLNKMAKKIKISPKYVIVFHEHYHNELFKFWVAQNFKSTKIIIGSHGAAAQELPAHFGLESRIANKKISFVNDDDCPSHKKVKLPFPKKINFIRKKPKLLIYSCYSPEYYPCRFGVSNNTYARNRNQNDLLTLKKNLKRNIFLNLRISSKATNYRSLNNIKKLFNGNKNIKNISFRNQLNSAKLVICTYPQTTFLESIASGPTVCLFNYEDWTPIKDKQKIYKKLIDNKIFFENTDELAYFINKKWDDIDIWWDDLKRKKVISEYLNIYQKEKDYLRPWKNYLKKIK